MDTWLSFSSGDSEISRLVVWVREARVELYAAVLITSVPVLIIFALLQNQVISGMTVGAVKG